MADNTQPETLSNRFRGFYPVVIDIETAGFDSGIHALLEIAAITLKMDNNGWLLADQKIHFHIEPFEGAVLDPEALAFTGIDPHNPLRGAVTEYTALHAIFKMVREGMQKSDCHRAVLVAHNSGFDHAFLSAAVKRCSLKRNPFHPFVTLDTASLSSLGLGQTVLAKACQTAGIDFDPQQAHSALYDTERTTELFCELVNRWKRLGGWPLKPKEPVTLLQQTQKNTGNLD